MIEETRHPMLVPAWIKNLSYALLISLMVIGMLVAVSLFYRTYFNHPPIEVVNLDSSTKHLLCPGESLDFNIHFTIQHEVLLYMYTNVMDEKQMYNINGAENSLPPDPHPRRGSFFKTIPWRVPLGLPPGRYYRALTVRSLVSSQEPLFILTPFEIPGGCK